MSQEHQEEWWIVRSASALSLPQITTSTPVASSSQGYNDLDSPHTIDRTIRRRPVNSPARPHHEPEPATRIQDNTGEQRNIVAESIPLNDISPGRALNDTLSSGIAILLETINAARRALDTRALIYSPFISEGAAQFAEANAEVLVPTSRVLQFYFRARHYNYQDARTQIKSISIASKAPSQRPLDAVRLISPANLGALACAELWISGKHKRHVFEVDERTHGQDCVCRDYDAYQVMIDKRFSVVGVAQSKHGRWIVDFVEEMS